MSKSIYLFIVVIVAVIAGTFVSDVSEQIGIETWTSRGLGALVAALMGVGLSYLLRNK